MLGSLVQGTCPLRFRIWSRCGSPADRGSASVPVVFIQLRFQPQAVQPRATVPERRAAHHDELEASPDQHLQDRRQRVFRDADIAVDPVGL